MRLIDVLLSNPRIPIFGRFEGLESEEDNEDDWYLEPIDAPLLEESEVSHFFVVKAKRVLPGKVDDCYIDICLPERISDHAYFVREGRLEKGYHHEFSGEIICAVPIDCFGVYDLFYSRTMPELGIEILQRGLEVASRKTFIAEDLGYILRDEGRFAEAADMFQLAVDNESSANGIIAELAACYEGSGQSELAAKYRALLDRSS
ncbi:tetratricopeptide repeat protein [Aeoliella sp.]|uniref:tetratricopeptide repeat protein n=1 Tax=Aeoliella sp. TaxID=2795800 RepID=UPI003CCB7A70